MLRIAFSIILICTLARAQNSQFFSVEQLRPKSDVEYKLFVLSDRMSIHTQTYEKVCAVVYPDGRYHMEQSKGLPDPGRPAVYEGTLSPEDSRALDAVIADPQLLQIASNVPLRSGPTRQFERLIATFQRPDGLHTFGLMSNEGKPAFNPAMRALADWTRKIVAETKPIKGAKADVCHPHGVILIPAPSVQP